MKAEAFDQKFDEGQEDIIDDLDLSQLIHPGYEQRRIDIDFPVEGSAGDSPSAMDTARNLSRQRHSPTRNSGMR